MNKKLFSFNQNNICLFCDFVKKLSRAKQNGHYGQPQDRVIFQNRLHDLDEKQQ